MIEANSIYNDAMFRRLYNQQLISFFIIYLYQSSTTAERPKIKYLFIEV